jgi:energy-coupling factor transporter ATP-binding protein EcfA2
MFLDSLDFVQLSKDRPDEQITDAIREYFSLPFAEIKNTEAYYATLSVEEIIRKVSEGIGKATLVNIERINSNSYSLQLDVLLLLGNAMVSKFFDFNRFERMEFSPDIDVIKIYDFDYDRRAIMRCRDWLDFFNNKRTGVLKDKRKQCVLQMYLGACLVDRSKFKFEYFMVLQGEAACGKSTILNVMEGLFGKDEIVDTSLSNISRLGDEGLRSTYRLRNGRIAAVREQNAKLLTGNSLVSLKMIASGERMSARGIGKDEVDIRPPLIVINSNYKFTSADFTRDDPNDDSVYRRAVVLNFDGSVPLRMRNPFLVDKLLEDRSAIFAWIVKGLWDLRKSNFKLPELKDTVIEKRLNEARANVIYKGKTVSGALVAYIRDKRISPYSDELNKMTYKIDISADELFNNLEKYCLKNGIVQITKTKMSAHLKSLDYLQFNNGSDKSRSYFSIYTTEEVYNNFAEIPSIAKIAASDLYKYEEGSFEDFVNDKI